MAKTFKSFVYDVKAIFNPEIINGMCYGKFRLSPEYKKEGAPFGFDWIRTGDAKDYVAIDKSYKRHVGRYYEEVNAIAVGNSPKQLFLPEKSLYKKLYNSYSPSNVSIYPSPNGRRAPYHVPVLSIYPYSGNKRDVANLILELNIRKSPARIELVYNTAHFEIEGIENIPTGAGVHKIKLSIKCIQEFAEDQYIRVVSFNSKGKRKNAGLIRVCKNKKQLRKEINVLLVNTKILISEEEDELPLVGEAQNALNGITQFLRHALMNPQFDIIDLDLGFHEDLLLRMTSEMGQNILVIRKQVMGGDGVIKTLQHTKETFEFLTNALTKVWNTENYDSIIFCLGINLARMLNKQLDRIAGTTRQKHILLKKDYQAETACHETLHSLGLGHTFENMAYDREGFAEYTYEKFATDNVMDYQKGGINRTNLWEWQWKKIRTKGFPEI